jgi:hypothetical protein
VENCARSRDRTGMEVNPLVFETSASTNSAIRAIVEGAKVIVFFIFQTLHVIFNGFYFDNNLFSSKFTAILQLKP